MYFSSVVSLAILEQLYRVPCCFYHRRLRGKHRLEVATQRPTRGGGCWTRGKGYWILVGGGGLDYHTRLGRPSVVNQLIQSSYQHRSIFSCYIIILIPLPLLGRGANGARAVTGHPRLAQPVHAQST